MRQRGVFKSTLALGRISGRTTLRASAGFLTRGHVLWDCVRVSYYTEASSVLQGKAGTLTQMGSQPAETVRRPRADAARNRERVLEAARAVFSAGGADASLEAVARRAGVGIGTLYRHFPTREALFEAVYRREVEQLGDLSEQLKNEASPVDALRRWLQSNVEFVATKKGMVAALALAAYSPSELHAFSFDRLTKAAGALLDRAVAAGEIRSDISPADLIRALVGMCYMHDQPGWQSTVMRLMDVFVDGLRVQGGAESKAASLRRGGVAGKGAKAKTPK
jgi:AcrR family transcriptional regulator